MNALSVKAVLSTPSGGIGTAERVTSQVCMGNTVAVSFKYLQPKLNHNVQKPESITKNCLKKKKKNLKYKLKLYGKNSCFKQGWIKKKNVSATSLLK